MSYETTGKALRVVAGVDVRHGQLASDDGHVGRVIKTDTPAQDQARGLRDIVAAGTSYNLRPRGVSEQKIVSLAVTGVAAWDLTGIAKGDLIYITDATNALSNASGAGKRVAGKVTHLAGEQGTPAGSFRLDLEQKA